MAYTPDLFADQAPAAVGPADWEAAWSHWFDAQRRAGHLQQTSSALVYQHMWSALSAWGVAQGITLDALAPSDLERFLRSRGKSARISDRHAWRFLRLVDRVLAQRARALGARPNPAAALLLEQRPELRFANASSKDPMPAFLAANEAARLVTFLSAVRPGRSSDGAQRWQEVRNRTAVALMLGAGVTPGEVRALVLTDVVVGGGRIAGVPWKLRVLGHAGSPARETPLAAWAGQLLAYWLSVRAEQAIPAAVLLPSTRSGKAWGKVSQYQATELVLTEAGLDAVEGGSFRLRHTFALRQLRRGSSTEDVAQWLGVADPAVLARYQRVLLAPVEVV